MIVISGRRYTSVKTYLDTCIKCKSCGSYSQEFTVYQRYFHFFWIPFIPIGKVASCQCTDCGDESNVEKIDYYCSITRTPIYMYACIFLLGLMFLNISIMDKKEEKLIQNYLASPQIGDVYKMTASEYSKKRAVHFAKVVAIQQDTVWVMENAFYYEGKKYIVEMDKDDYFITNIFHTYLKAELLNLREERKILSIVRNYSKQSNFHNEQEIELEDDNNDDEQT